MTATKLIVCIGGERQLIGAAERIKRKWCSKPGREASSCEIFQLMSPDPSSIPEHLMASLKSPQNEVAFLSHGHPAINNALFAEFSDKLVRFSLQSIADVIGLLTDKEYLGSLGKPAIKVNLICCLGGYKKDRETPSIAENLQSALLARELRADITARKTYVSIEMSGRKTTVPMVDRDRIVAMQMKIQALAVEDKDSIAICQRDIATSLHEAPKEIHALNSKVVVSAREDKAGVYRIEMDAAHVEPSLIQRERSKNALRAFSQLWVKYTDGKAVTEEQLKCVEAIRNDIAQCRFDSNGEILLVIDVHEERYESISIDAFLLALGWF
ncbi:MAG: C80 family cysteine peptidase [Coxiellaceae bacterium]|nr:C80 family cysteine peptidase [Coxiellaceae bacterium]